MATFGEATYGINNSNHSLKAGPRSRTVEKYRIGVVDAYRVGGRLKQKVVSNPTFANADAVHTFDSTTASGLKPLQNPTLPAPVSSYGMHGS